MADTTSINDLPENVTMTVNSLPPIQFPQVPPQQEPNNIVNFPSQPPQASQQSQQLQQIDQSVITRLVTGLQQASASGATRLKSSDIPMDILPLTADPNIQQNHIPHHFQFQGNIPHHNQSPYQQHDQDYPNYIQEEDNMDDIITRNTKKTAYNNQIEMWMNEFQVPLMVAILFFLFQLPIVKKLFHQYLPFLYYLDGNMNVNGYILVSLFFGIIYYVLCKILN